MLRQHWDRIHRPKYRVLDWSTQQQKVLNRIREGTSIDDEEAKQKSTRWSYVSGAPGSGKSALILEGAVAAAKAGLHVLIVCPTGQLVHSFKAQLPDVDGIENISIDTIQGVLDYQRPGKDRQVRWAPPTALRRYDLILVDEASQYDDREWDRFFTSVREQPHLPYCVVVADFQQLQPIGSGGNCRRLCEVIDNVELDTVYRCYGDDDHLLFCNQCRFQQPEKPSCRTISASATGRSRNIR